MIKRQLTGGSDPNKNENQGNIGALIKDLEKGDLNNHDNDEGSIIEDHVVRMSLGSSFESEDNSEVSLYGGGDNN